MAEFRCKKCSQLQFKHKLIGDKLIIEIKCYACNTFNYFYVNLNNVLKKYDDNKQE